MIQQETYILPTAETVPDFESLYLAVRGLEQRIYTDEQLRQLPEIAPSHVHYKEWQIRKRSAERLVSYLAKKKKSLAILEIGCGNGWLAAKLAGLKDARVFALDVNAVELEQAKRVFKKSNLQFFEGDFSNQYFVGLKFDVIVFAASIQYFSPLKDILTKMQGYLADGGEIHIIDSNFYTEQTTEGARQRTFDYYKKISYPQLAAHYFHHRLDELAGFNHRILSNPNGIKNRLLKGSPFYWVRINKDAA
ncbi:class I SAM-dependent methyltransferase [Mucilaginibacter sp. ZT4R22]|uniref:Class I SAM-dependent methyltransferase n=1 Tax=Mucilaginibacter pankratovii TaxID=2772110 RepID=A0ABR7WRF0_9SPHI|nr:class I SAM-dependent methyltransferase [Mucilaginibacter pankratovii]MBD1364889.1 class I SAM-dependent methyltransferase [Mucilaginibacter pankratovii]